MKLRPARYKIGRYAKDAWKDENGNLVTLTPENEAFYFPPKKKKVHIPYWVRHEVFKRDDFTCRNCGSTDHLEVDHIKPESKGGESALSNFQTLCRTCNRRKSNKS